ncbi:MAG: hypothetical protein WEA09_05215 [Gemmatimonadota bacterium]
MTWDLGVIGSALPLIPLVLLTGWAPFLTLLFLSAWSLGGLGTPLPGLLPRLGGPGFLVSFALLYGGNLLLHRPAVTRLPWSLLLCLAAPLVAILTVLVSQDPPPRLDWVGMGGLILVGAMAFWAQATRGGVRLLPALRQQGRPSPILLHLAEDSLVLAALVAWAEGTAVSLLVEGFLLLGVLVLSRPAWRLQQLAPHLLRGAIRLLLQAPSWRPWQELPAWVRAGGSRELPTGNEELRGGPAALVGNPEVGGIRTGWLLPGPGSLLFLFRRRGRTWAVDLHPGPLHPESHGPFAMILLVPGASPSSPWRLVVPRDLPLLELDGRNPNHAPG